jgi:hypothetical protein
MLAASVLAIFFIPVSFEVVEKFGQWASGKKKETHAGVPHPVPESAGDD